MKVNYYEVLGVDRNASDAEIRERFRKLAREKHPDRFTGLVKEEAELKFQTLTEAMNVLTNPQRRKQHDAEIGAGGKSATDPAQIAKGYMGAGAKAFKDGDFKAAYEAFDMASKHNPQDTKSFHYLALAAARIPGHSRQMIQAIETAVQKEPYNPVYLKDAGMLCRRAGLTAKAERYFEDALQWGANPEIEAALAELRQSSESAEKPKSGGILGSLFKKG